MIKSLSLNLKIHDMAINKWTIFPDVDALDGVPLDDACAEGYFRCSPVSQRCLAQYHWCDGHSSDCENGEDESIETCGESDGFVYGVINH